MERINLIFSIFLGSILSWIALFYILWDGILLGIIILVWLLWICQLLLGGKNIFPLIIPLCFWVCVWLISTIYNENIIDKNTAIIDKYSGQYISFTWEIVDLQSRSEFYDSYILQARSISSEDVEWKKLFFLTRIPKNYTLEIGDTISFSGKVYRFENFNGFGYERYMLSKKLYFSTSASNFEIVQKSSKGLKYTLRKYRESFIARINQLYPSEEAIFLGWILLWARENIPDDLSDDFNNSGLTHFIAVSGFNITLCVMFVIFLFGFLPSIFRIILVSVSIIAFSFFVWLWAPVVRASIMWILWYIFLESGTKTQNITLLLFTWVCMTLISPLTLLYDVSLHLSFLAVIWIIYTQEFWSKIFSFLPSFFAIREAFVLTLSALVFALPIMIFQFWQVSLFAPFANIAVTWTIPIAMLLWAISIIADLISGTLWQFLWFFAYLFLAYDISMVRFFGNLDFALLEFDFWAYKNYLLSLYFVIMTYIVFLYQTYYKT